MGLSVEVVSEWVKSCNAPKELDKLSAAIERQRSAIAAKVAAKSAKKSAK